jgi:hypothetical protein
LKRKKYAGREVGLWDLLSLKRFAREIFGDPKDGGDDLGDRGRFIRYHGAYFVQEDKDSEGQEIRILYYSKTQK